jgi:hypothetical protein
MFLAFLLAPANERPRACPIPKSGTRAKIKPWFSEEYSIVALSDTARGVSMYAGMGDGYRRASAALAGLVVVKWRCWGVSEFGLARLPHSHGECGQLLHY